MLNSVQLVESHIESLLRSDTGFAQVPFGPYLGESGEKGLNEGDVGDLGEFGVDKPRAAHKVDVEEYAQPSS